ncbi:ATP-binding cassette transporter snq2, partial [Coemansia sp. RSA 552]
FVDQTKMGKGRLRRRSPFTTTFWFQLSRLLQREWEIAWGDKETQIFLVVYYIIFAVIVGTLYLRLPVDSSGAFTRGGLLFFALVFGVLTCEAEIPKTVLGRGVIYKHKAFAMYHPAALSLAQMLVSLPFFLVQMIIFSIVLYFITGLSATAGQFFAFLLYLFVGMVCMAGFFRLVGSLLPSAHVAQMVSDVCLTFWILLIGYLQPPNSMHPWFKWIYWINPLAYGFKALMCNEFRNLELRCTGTSLIPNGPGFDNIDNQVCTLQGAMPGQAFVRGRDYLAEGYQFYIDDQWIDFVALLCFTALFVFGTALAIEFIEYGNAGYSISVFKRRKPRVDVVTKDKAADSKEAAMYSDLPPEGPTDEQIIAGTTFTWTEVNYTVPVKGGSRQLLDSVAGYIKPGTMTALMGVSGAGKTTLLDSLSQRKTIGTLEGEILMNGAPQPRSFRRVTGYCEQLDVHNPFATVREALRFSAYLRQPASVPDSEKNEHVECVIFLLDMAEIANCFIGDLESGKGLSLEERKRLTIGVELVSKPKILFLDEPTSGLDAQASFKIVHFLRRLAAEGQTILCTIHQPSAMLFELFDRLLLLVRGGHTVYFGDLGPDAQTLIQYFERNGADRCPPTANPAEYILDVVGSKSATIDWPQTWRDSKEKQATVSEIERVNQLKHESGGNHGSDDDDDDATFARSHMYQTKLVARRMLTMYWRNPEYNLMGMTRQLLCALAVGFAYYNLSDSASDLQNKVFAIFQCAILSVFVIIQVQPEFLRQRQYYGREASTNQYGWRAFSVAIIFTEWPFLIFSGTVFFVAFYWTAGLNGISDRIGYFYVLYQALVLFSSTHGQAIASFVANDVVAAMLNPIFSTMMILFCGVAVPYAQMPKFWRSWMYWATPYLYYVEGVITNDLHGAEVRCRDNEHFIFEPPSGQSCAEYAGGWVEQAVGYINNPNATENCQYCPFKVGDEFYQSLDWSFAHRWRNFGILMGFVVFNIAFTVLMIRVYKVNKR